MALDLRTTTLPIDHRPLLAVPLQQVIDRTTAHYEEVLFGKQKRRHRHRHHDVALEQPDPASWLYKRRQYNILPPRVRRALQLSGQMHEEFGLLGPGFDWFQEPRVNDTRKQYNLFNKTPDEPAEPLVVDIDSVRYGHTATKTPEFQSEDEYERNQQTQAIMKDVMTKSVNEAYGQSGLRLDEIISEQDRSHRQMKKRKAVMLRRLFRTLNPQQDAPPMWQLEKHRSYKAIPYPVGTNYGAIADELIEGSTSAKSLYDMLLIYSSVCDRVLEENRETTVPREPDEDHLDDNNVVWQCLGTLASNTRDFVRVRNSVTKKFTSENVDVSLLYGRGFNPLSLAEKRSWTNCLDLGQSVTPRENTNVTTQDLMDYLYPADDQMADVFEKYLEGEKAVVGSFVDEQTVGGYTLKKR